MVVERGTTAAHNEILQDTLQAWKATTEEEASKSAAFFQAIVNAWQDEFGFTLTVRSTAVEEDPQELGKQTPSGVQFYIPSANEPKGLSTGIGITHVALRYMDRPYLRPTKHDIVSITAREAVAAK